MLVCSELAIAVRASAPAATRSCSRQQGPARRLGRAPYDPVRSTYAALSSCELRQKVTRSTQRAIRPCRVHPAAALPTKPPTLLPVIPLNQHVRATASSHGDHHNQWESPH